MHKGQIKDGQSHQDWETWKTAAVFGIYKMACRKIKMMGYGENKS